MVLFIAFNKLLFYFLCFLLLIRLPPYSPSPLPSEGEKENREEGEK